MNSAILLLGTNLGDRLENLNKACILLEEKVGTIQKRSGIYETEPWGYRDNQWFYNCALILQTHLVPEKLIKKTLEIEMIMGRERKQTNGYENRILDIDILSFDSEIIKTTELELPHPRLHLRKFALMPLAEIAPDYIHPTTMKSVNEMLTECIDNCIVISIGNQ